MKVPVKNLRNEEVGEIDLDDAVFGGEPRADIMHRMVRYQLAKRRSGSHKVKGRSEVSGTGKKPWRQKGTGRARQGSMRSPQFRGGGTVFGPQVRDHGFELPKKVKKLALKSALATKVRDGKLIVLESAAAESHKTKPMAEAFKGLGIESALLVAGSEVDATFSLAIRNLPKVDALPQIGANVYDILNHEHLVLTREAVDQLSARLA